MIGGIETSVPTPGESDSLHAAVRVIRQYWPNAVFENGDTGDPYGEFWQIPFGELNEIFVYRDQSIADRWDAEGAVAELRNTMIHLIADGDVLTVVVDEKDDEMTNVIASVRSAIANLFLWLPKLRAA